MGCGHWIAMLERHYHIELRRKRRRFLSYLQSYLPAARHQITLPNQTRQNHSSISAFRRTWSLPHRMRLNWRIRMVIPQWMGFNCPSIITVIVITIISTVHICILIVSKFSVRQWNPINFEGRWFSFRGCVFVDVVDTVDYEDYDQEVDEGKAHLMGRELRWDEMRWDEWRRFWNWFRGEVFDLLCDVRARFVSGGRDWERLA